MARVLEKLTTNVLNSHLRLQPVENVTPFPTFRVHKQIIGNRNSKLSSY